MTDLERAKELLTGSANCVLVKGDITYISRKRGIAPMLDFLGAGVPLDGFSAADRIVGKAAAMLFVRAGVVSVYGEVMSRSGADFLEACGVDCSWGELAEVIINREGTGMCPMEQTVLEMNDYHGAFCALSAKRALLRRKNK